MALTDIGNDGWMDGIASRQSREIQKDGGRQREADAEMETASDRLTGKVPNINHLDKSFRHRLRR